MARFDVFTNPDKSERDHTPYVLDLQNSHLAMLGTFIAVPLRAEAYMTERISSIHPTLTIDGQQVVMDTPMMATFAKRGLGLPVTHLRPQQSEIQDALDTLFGER